MSIDQNTQEVTYFDCETEEEVCVALPHKNEVCPKCEGYGTHLTESIGNHAYSSEEFEEAFPEDEDKEQYFRRGGIYDVQCTRCGGKRVVLVVDEEACTTPEQKAHLKAYLKAERRRAREEEEDRRTRWYEDGCPMD